MNFHFVKCSGNSFPVKGIEAVTGGNELPHHNKQPGIGKPKQ